jgi:hypothetical protein
MISAVWTPVLPLRVRKPIFLRTCLLHTRFKIACDQRTQAGSKNGSEGLHSQYVLRRCTGYSWTILRFMIALIVILDFQIKGHMYVLFQLNVQAAMVSKMGRCSVLPQFPFIDFQLIKYLMLPNYY